MSQHKLTVVGADIHSDNLEEITGFLAEEGIQFGRYELNHHTTEFSAPNSLSDEQRQTLLASYPQLKDKYSKLGGYKSDVICLYPEFEHLDFIMRMFGDVHYHFENEYWYVFDGRLGFIFYSPRGFKFRIIVQAGEYVQVPEGIWQQCFFAAKEDRVKSMRFFNTTGTVTMPAISF